MPADLHDRVMAAVSHLPHVAAYALAGALGRTSDEEASGARRLPTTSLRDTSRIAGSSAAMWTDIFLENRVALLPFIDELASRIGDLRAAIAGEDASALTVLLERARAARARILPE